MDKKRTIIEHKDVNRSQDEKKKTEQDKKSPSLTYLVPYVTQPHVAQLQYEATCAREETKWRGTNKKNGSWAQMTNEKRLFKMSGLSQGQLYTKFTPPQTNQTNHNKH